MSGVVADPLADLVADPCVVKSPRYAARAACSLRRITLSLADRVADDDAQASAIGS